MNKQTVQSAINSPNWKGDRNLELYNDHKEDPDIKKLVAKYNVSPSRIYDIIRRVKKNLRKKA